jgi:hypothetical protein
MNFFRLLRISKVIGRAKALVDSAPEKFARYNASVQAKGLPPLVYGNESDGYFWNLEYSLHSWGIVFPNYVQFQIRYLRSDGLVIEMHQQYLFPIDELF